MVRYFSTRGWCHITVFPRTNDITMIFWWTFWNSRKSRSAIISEVSINFPKNYFTRLIPEKKSNHVFPKSADLSIIIPAGRNDRYVIIKWVKWNSASKSTRTDTF